MAPPSAAARQPDRRERFGVVVFTGGPLLEPAAGEFLARLEEDPGIDLLAVFHESSGGDTLGAVIADAWRRRGALALPVLAAQALRAAGRMLRAPRSEILRLRRIAALTDRIHRVPDVHAPAVIDRIRQLAPQLGLIYGGPILKPALFEIPTLGTLGIHHGKLPEYRGKKTTFWAMFNGEGSVGVTIQRVNAGLDTGEVVESGAVAIGRLPLGVVWSRLEALGLELYVQAIHAIRCGTATFHRPSGARGPLYRDPRLPDVLAFWWRYLVRLVRGPGPDGLG